MDAATLVDRLGDWDRGRGHRSRRLARAVAAAVSDGRLPAGTWLPAERSLAEGLAVSRGTVARAYEALRSDGVVETRHGRGTAVGGLADDDAPTAARLAADAVSVALAAPDRESIDLRAAAWEADADVLACYERARARGRASGDLAGHGYWPLGHPRLRAAVAAHLTRQGLPTEASQVLITVGAQAAVDLVVTARTRPGDPVLVEELTWPGALELLSIRHCRPRPIPVVARDHVGALRPLRERRAELAYLIPTHHNPTGEVAPAPARRLLVEAAAEGGGLVIDDLSHHDLWIDAPPPAPLAAHAPEHAAHVITVGALSKPFWGGLRLGWVRGEPDVFDELARVKAAIDFGAPLDAQLTAAAVLDELDGLLARRRAELAHRRDALLAALRHHLPQAHATRPAGGLSCWLTHGDRPGELVAAAAARQGLRVPAGRPFSPTGADRGLRLSLGRPAPELEEAARRLGQAVAAAPHAQAPPAPIG